MSIEKLQERIRKMKNPSVIDLSTALCNTPDQLLDQYDNPVEATGQYCKDLLNGLKGIVPAVRLSYGWFALLGSEYLFLLRELIQEAKKYGYYVLLDSIASDSWAMAEQTAQTLMDLPCDGVIVSVYAGSDVLKPYIKRMKDSPKSVFAVIRNANKSAPQLQDLMTGSRLVHVAAADIVKRLGENTIGRSGYSQLAAVCAATSADSIRMLRSKYKNMFFLLDGYDYTGANAKNCSYAFDNLGHGALACAGDSITGAWKESQEDYLDSAVTAAERMRKNLTRYITIL